MRQFKELIIRKPKPYRSAQLELNGKWLDGLGFSIGTHVNAYFNEGCLFLSTDPTSRNDFAVLVVNPKRVRGRVRPQLLIDGYMVRRLGYRINDRLGLVLERGKIQIMKINHPTTEERDCFD